jgi:hypothetical protein
LERAFREANRAEIIPQLPLFRWVEAVVVSAVKGNQEMRAPTLTGSHPATIIFKQNTSKDTNVKKSRMIVAERQLLFFSFWHKSTHSALFFLLWWTGTHGVLAPRLFCERFAPQTLNGRLNIPLRVCLCTHDT